MVNKTMIQTSVEVRDHLKSMKLFPRESYDHLLIRLMNDVITKEVATDGNKE